MCSIMFELYQRFPHSYFDISEVQKFRSCILQIIWAFNHLHQSKTLDLNPLCNSDRMRTAFLTNLPAKFNIDSQPGLNKNFTPGPVCSFCSIIASSGIVENSSAVFFTERKACSIDKVFLL